MTIRTLRASNARARGGKLRPPNAKLKVAENKGKTELFLYGAIFHDPMFESEVSADDVVTALADIEGDVTVRINSPGGVVTEGMAIYNALVEHGQEKGKVTTQVDGVAASIAADILCAGDERLALGEGAFVMIHKAWGLAIGNADELEAYIPTLRKMDKAQARIFGKTLSLSDEEIEAAMSKDTWFDAEEAQAAGFITGVKGDKGAQALARSFDYSAYGDNVPNALAKRQAHFDDGAPDDAVVQIPAASDAACERRMRFALASDA